VAKLLIENDNFESREEIIAIWCHIIMYMASDIINGEKPRHVGDGLYTPPTRGMFLNNRDTKWFKENHNEGKWYFTLFNI
jgi:hypothetical protein